MVKRYLPLACCVLSLLGQGTPPRSFEIELPPGAPSESVFIRYCLAGEFGDRCSWVLPKRDVSAYSISATNNGVPAVRIKAIVYVPGCKMQTVDFAPTVWKEPRYSFVCTPLPAVSVSGVVTRADRLYGKSVQLQAKYLAYWGKTFFGGADGLVTSIPVGASAPLTSGNRFQITVPDFSQDSLADPADHPGVLQIWANDSESGDLVALVIPADHNAGEKATNLGGLNIEAKYPSDIVFIACATSQPHLHDHNGFAIRPDPQDACDR